MIITVIHMKYYKHLLSLKIFTTEDIILLCGNVNTAHSIITSYQKRKLIKRVRQNLYIALDKYKRHSVNKFMIASKISKNNYISHYSAVEFYKMSKEFNKEVYVSGGTRFNTFSFEDYNYYYIKPKICEGVVTFNNISITDKERTILDNINDFEKIGGIDILYDILPRFCECIDYDKVLKYLSLYNKQSMYQKTGYLLGEFDWTDDFHKSFFYECSKHIGNAAGYLYSELKTKEKRKFDRKWRLYVPIKAGKHRKINEEEPRKSKYYTSDIISSSDWGLIGGHKVSHQNWKGNY